MDELSKEQIDAITSSQAFKAINVIIDNYLCELRGYEMMVIDQAKMITDNPGGSHGGMIITTRIDQEVKDRKDATAQLTLSTAFYTNNDALMFAISRVKHLREVIGELQATKLRLVNDCDFPGGNHERMKIFGF